MAAPSDTPKQQHSSVVVSPLALASMMLHAASHSTTVVHGVLLGQVSLDESKKSAAVLRVTDAVPVCHEHPTQPLVETALALIRAQQQQQQQQLDNNENNNKKVIVGWYTAPERMEDERPGPAALRIVASLAANNSTDDNNNNNKSSTLEPVLLVLRNGPLARLLLGGPDAAAKHQPQDAVVIALGKDFGQQWLEPLKVTTERPDVAQAAARQASCDSDSAAVHDLVDHWQAPSASTEWYPCKALVAAVDKLGTTT